MADKTQMLAEAYRRGLLPPDKAAAYEEAMRRNLVPRVQPRKPGVIEDVGRSFVAGVERGVQGLLSAKGDAIDLGSNAAIDAALRAGLITRQQAAQARKTVTGIRQNRIQVPIVSNVLGNAPTSAELRAGAMVPYEPQTRAGRYGRAIGENVPNALAPGGAVARTANVLAPAIAGEGAAQLAEGMGAGEGGQALARVAGSVVGGAVASVRPNALRPPEQRNALNPLTRTTRQDPNALRARAQEFRDAGIDPTLADVVDESGRGVMRAAASRMSPGRQAAQEFAEGRALDLPDRMSQQARRIMSPDPRTPDQIRQAQVAARSANASRAFGAVRGEVVDLGDDAVGAMRVPEVIDAIADAARRERDPTARQQLLALGQWARSGSADPPPAITVGMADRISRVLLGKAQGTTDRDLAATLRMYGEAIREPARQASPGYGEALQEFAADSRLVEAADIGQDFLRRNTDEFVAGVQNMDDDARALALASGRRAVERAAGENVAAAPGVARRIALAPEQQARNRALLGPERADEFQNAMRLEERALRNANDIVARVGAQSQPRAQDAEAVEGAMRLGGQLWRRDFIGAGLDWLRSRGMNDQQAQLLIEASIDPARLDEAIAYIERAFGPEEARQFLQLRNLGAVTAISAASQSAPAAAEATRSRGQ